MGKTVTIEEGFADSKLIIKYIGSFPFHFLSSKVLMFLRHNTTELIRQSKFCSKIYLKVSEFILFVVSHLLWEQAVSGKKWPRNHILKRDRARGRQITINRTCSVTLLQWTSKVCYWSVFGCLYNFRLFFFRRKKPLKRKSTVPYLKTL